MTRVVALLTLVLGCSAAPPLRLDETWPTVVPGYSDTTERWTRRTSMSHGFQESLDIVAVIKSPDWRAAHAARQADHRGLTGTAREALLGQAKADMTGPYEIELLVTTWDRRENDLDRGKKSAWRVALIDDTGREHQPIEIVKDRRPPHIVRAEFPALGDFATAYIARFPRTAPVFGPEVRTVRLRLSSERGGVEVEWSSH